MSEQLELFPETLPLPAAEVAVVRDTASAGACEKMSPAPSGEAALAEKLRRYLEKRVRLPIALTITDNRTTMMSVKRDPRAPGPRVRLHRMFLHAPEPVLAAIAHWVQHPRSQKGDGLVKAYISGNANAIKPRARTRAVRNDAGRHHHLKAIFDALNQSRFQGKLTAAIVWGRETGRGTRHIRLGCYEERENLIRIHPRLDQDFVPDYVVRAIVHHEMLHAWLGVRVSEAGRRQVHPRNFKELERAYPDHGAAEAWLKQQANLKRILKPAMKPSGTRRK